MQTVAKEKKENAAEIKNGREYENVKKTYVTDDVSGGLGCYNRNSIFGKEVSLVYGVHIAFSIIFLGKQE